jgi:hypothetical protein
MKISKFHKNILKLESMATKTNFIALIIFGSLFCYFVAPFLMYSFYVIDSNVLGGWVHEPLSPLAKTTNEKNYYSSSNIPFHTVEDLKIEKIAYERGLRLGLHGTYYEQYWNRTRQAMIDGAKNFAYSFLPTPIDPVAPRKIEEDLPLFWGHRLRRLEDEPDSTDPYAS